MKFQQPPLKIACDGLSSKLIFDLADRLRLHFECVDVFGNDIFASKPLSVFHYGEGWRIIDAFGVKAA
ncbi:MAG: hypothetical protein IKD80_04640 [Selenomonadaceae bacterium]|nr:hypothetical protein [Selenomonadaceae bacterium]